MSTDKKNQNISKSSSSTVTIVEETATATLTPLEEKVIRMHHGLSEGDDHELQFAAGASEEDRLKLALLEEAIMTALYANIKDLE